MVLGRGLEICDLGLGPRLVVHQLFICLFLSIFD